MMENPDHKAGYFWKRAYPFHISHVTSPSQVNLLDDHLVDVLLDSAAGGWNTVEREADGSDNGRWNFPWSPEWNSLAKMVV